MDTVIASEKRKGKLLNQSYINKAFILSNIVLVLLYFCYYDYLVFHTVIEIFSIVVAFIILLITISAGDAHNSTALMIVGIAYGFIGAIDLLHTLTYDGIGVISQGVNVPTQFWIVGRYMESISLLIVAICIKKKLKLSPYLIFNIYFAVSALISLSILHWRIFPDSFIDGVGLTPFKIVSEYIICVFLAISVILLIRHRLEFSPMIYRSLLLSLIFTILSEMSFTMYTDVTDTVNMVGHFFKLVSFYYVFKCMYESNINTPYKLLRKVNIKLNNENIHRIKVEEELAKKGELLSAILNSTREGILVVDNDRKVLHANKKFQEIWQFSEKTMKIESAKDLIKVYRDKVEDLSSFEMKINETNKILKETLSTVNFKDGRIVEVLSKPFVIEGKKSGRIWCYKDITKRVSWEKKSREAEIREKLLIKDREYDRLKIEFFTNLSHDLKTPLNVILGSIQLSSNYLRNNVGGQEGKRAIGYINVMKQNCYRLLRLVNNLVDIAKIDDGHFNLNLGVYNIVEIVEDITLSVADYIETKGIQLIFDTEIEERFVECDPDKIERIILNLLSNSIKFTDPGGIIKVNITNRDNNVLISVSDTGIGIPKDKLGEIFSRFKQVDETLVRNYQGTGIGLSLVKSLVEMHGGNITLESEFGKGSTFNIELPIKEYIEVEEAIEGTIKNNGAYIDDGNYMNSEAKIEKINIEFSDIYS